MLTQSESFRELHMFRGHEPAGAGLIMGHEFTGTVVAKGSAVADFRIGDKVVSPFTVSWYVLRSDRSSRYAGSLENNVM